MQLTNSYARWSEVYDQSAGELSKDTWKKGILAEVIRLKRREGRVLDLGAGTGIGSEVLKTAGSFHVVALDRSREMLDKNMSADEKIVSDFMSVREINQKFDIIVSGFDSLNFLTKEQLPIFFFGISDVLADDGYVIFDYSSPNFLSVNWKHTDFIQKLSGFELRWKVRYDQANKCSRSEISLWKSSGMEWADTYVQYAMNAYEIQEALEGTGLKVELVRNLESSGFSPSANTHVYVISNSKLEG